MGKEFIGKRVRLQIGGEPSKDDKDKIIGEDVNVHLGAEDLQNYSSITGEKIELELGSNVNAMVGEIMSAIERSAEQRKAEIIAICKQILAEQDEHAKARWIERLVSIGSGVASIASSIFQLSQWLGRDQS